MPRPIEYYLRVGAVAFDFVGAHPKCADIVQREYISFVSVLLCAIENGIPVKPELFDPQDQWRLKAVSVPWCSFSTERCLTYPHTSAQVLGRILSASSPPGNLKVILAIVPMGVPGMGKSTFFRQLTEYVQAELANQIGVVTISSDDIRKQCMDEIKARSPGLPINELFEQAGKEARCRYNKVLERLIQIDTVKAAKPFVLALLDKNHPPNAIEGTLKTLRQSCPEQFTLRVAALLPKTVRSYQCGDTELPFSLNFLFNCMNRVQSRANHPTLNGDGIQSLNVQIMFHKLYQGIKLGEASLVKNGFDFGIRYPFVYEDELSHKDIPAEIEAAYQRVLASTFAGQQCTNSQYLTEFLQLFEDNVWYFGCYSKQEIQKEVAGAVQLCLEKCAHPSAQLPPEEQKQTAS